MSELQKWEGRIQHKENVGLLNKLKKIFSWQLRKRTVQADMVVDAKAMEQISKAKLAELENTLKEEEIKEQRIKNELLKLELEEKKLIIENKVNRIIEEKSKINFDSMDKNQLIKELKRKIKLLEEMGGKITSNNETDEKPS